MAGEKEALHHGQAELIDGHFVPCFEKPERADLVLARVQAVGLGEVMLPTEHGLDPVLRVHRADFVEFLSTAWSRWTALGRTHDALPLIWPVPSLRRDVRPQHIDGQLGWYALDAGVPVMAGTWTAARDAVPDEITAITAVATASVGRSWPRPARRSASQRRRCIAGWRPCSRCSGRSSNACCCRPWPVRARARRSNPVSPIRWYRWP